jgi:hypothetical protein
MIHEHEESVSGGSSSAELADDFEMSPLGNELSQIRKKFIAEGGKLLTRKELEQEIADRRGGVYALKTGLLEPSYRPL